MISLRCTPLGLLLLLSVGSGTVLSQTLPVRPPTGPGGNASYELNRIYSDSIGRYHSASSFTQTPIPDAQIRFAPLSISSTYYGGGSSGTRANVSRPAATFGGSSGPLNKPFSTVSPSPTVSPYLRMFSDTFDDVGNSEYITNVRPLLEQQQMNRQLQLQQQMLERRVREVAAAPAFSPRGSETQLPTGHTTVFLNTGRYYPMNFRRR